MAARLRTALSTAEHRRASAYIGRNGLRNGRNGLRNGRNGPRTERNGNPITAYRCVLSQCGGPKKETNQLFQLKRTAVTPFTQSKRAHKCITFQQ
jgi:hypothetical protein